MRESFNKSTKFQPDPGCLSAPSFGRLLLRSLVLAVFCLSFISGPLADLARAESGESPGPMDIKRLEGSWVRPDGGYLLQLKDIKKDGSLKATYYNPRPINVGRAELHKQGGKITLVVELRDVNYPGSAYTLRYDPSDDRLKGSYYQAVDKQTYEIEFFRSR
jgi:hypothetical protein